MQKRKIKIGLTAGDINGIATELIIKTFSDKRIFNYCTPILYSSPSVLAYYKKVLKIEQLNFQAIADADNAKDKALNVIRVWSEEISISMGKRDKGLDRFSLKSIENAVADLKAKKLDALVTLPVSKSVFQLTDEKFSGHTEFLCDRLEQKNNLMIMVNDHLKVALTTIHIPIHKVAESINQALIVDKAKLLHQSLKYDFGIEKPKLAILALNPHAGDDGLTGNEEIEIIKPAISQLNDEKILCFGPFPADGFFGSGNYLKFDGTLAMYHDQGLAPFKLVAGSIGGGVNYTAGMDYVRTSPDHGPAYDVAGKGISKIDSFREAIFKAKDIVLARRAFDERHLNPLKKENLKEASIRE